MVDQGVAMIVRNRGNILLDGGAFPTIPHQAGDTPEAAARDGMARLLVDPVAGEVTRVGSSQTLGNETYEPVLIDVPDRRLAANSIDQPSWVHASSLLLEHGDIDRWRCYRAVGPTTERVLRDTTHGSSTLSIRALETIRDRAVESASSACQGDWEAVVRAANEFVTARPSFTALVNRIDRAITRGNGDAATLVAVCREEIDRTVRADSQAAGRCLTWCADTTVLTLSRSGTVQQTLEKASHAGVFVLESRPENEGVLLAEALTGEENSPTLATDAAVAQLIEDHPIDQLLVGADTIDPDGTVHNKVGTRTAAIIASRAGLPVGVVTSLDSIAPESLENIESFPPAAIYDGAAPVRAVTRHFDQTPSSLIDTIITERGHFHPFHVNELAAHHRAHRAWRSG